MKTRLAFYEQKYVYNELLQLCFFFCKYAQESNLIESNLSLFISYCYYKFGCTIDGLNRAHCSVKVGQELVVGGRLDTCYVSGSCVTLDKDWQYIEASIGGSTSLGCHSLGYPWHHETCHLCKLRSSVKNITKLAKWIQAIYCDCYYYRTYFEVEQTYILSFQLKQQFYWYFL